MKMVSFKEAIVYEIHPQSFNDANNDGIGDLKGIIQKLDYLMQLGINYIYLNLIYVSPQKDNGYDIADYQNINPIFGTMHDFELLVKEEQKRNINIMMDMIFNHCSINHEWFQKALKGNKKYMNRFFFIKNEKGPPTNWKSKFGGSVWEYNKELKMYYLHLFDKTQSDLNWNDIALREDIYQIINFWINKGVKGLRFDVINLIGKPLKFQNDQESDGHKFYTDSNNVHQYIYEMAKNSYKKYNDVITVGELSATSIMQAAKYTNPINKELDMVFTFHHLKIDYLNNNKWMLKKYQPQNLIAVIKEWQIKLQLEEGWLALFLNNHDQPRALSRFGDPINYRYESASALAGLTLLLRGTPYLYQGEEFGMENNNYSKLNDFSDVESKNYYKILKQQGITKKEILKVLTVRSRDNARTPMQWNNSKSIFKTYQKLIALRKKNNILKYGDIDFFDLHPNVLSFYRIYQQEKWLVIINLSKDNINLELSKYKEKIILYTNYDNFIDTLKPYQLIILK